MTEKIREASLIWITGLAGSGKTTIGNEVFKKMKEKYINTVFLDGDSFREILGNDLGHNQTDRLNNALRISRMCKFLINQNINVICATISLFKEIHQFNRTNFRNYFEVFIEVDKDELLKRDQKGIYSKALKGEIENVVGVDLPFDKPDNADLTINNTKADKLVQKAEQILKLINNFGDL